MDFCSRTKSILGSIFGKSPRLAYLERGRSGSIRYIEGLDEIQFYYEFGGGNCELCIDVPDEAKWEKQTNFPKDRRIEILHFIGRTVVNEKYSGNRQYEIGDSGINILGISSPNK